MIRLDPRRILIALLATDMALLSAFLLAEYGGGPMRLRALVDMNRDLSIPAWWSAAQLLVAGLLAIGYGLLLRGRGRVVTLEAVRAGRRGARAALGR